MEMPDTHMKTVSDNATGEAPRIIQRTKEASREEAIASTRHFLLQWTEEIQMLLLEVLQKF